MRKRCQETGWGGDAAAWPDSRPCWPGPSPVLHTPLGSVSKDESLFLERDLFLSIPTVYFCPGLAILSVCVTREHHSPMDQTWLLLGWPGEPCALQDLIWGMAGCTVLQSRTCREP